MRSGLELDPDDKDKEEEKQLADCLFPPECYCSVSHQLFVDPVITCNGFTFERSFITDWFKHKTTCPMTREQLSDLKLIPNRAIKSLIEDLKAKQLGKQIQLLEQRLREAELASIQLMQTSQQKQEVDYVCQCSPVQQCCIA